MVSMFYKLVTEYFHIFGEMDIRPLCITAFPGEGLALEIDTEISLARNKRSYLH